MREKGAEEFVLAGGLELHFAMTSSIEQAQRFIASGGLRKFRRLKDLLAVCRSGQHKDLSALGSNITDITDHSSTAGTKKM